MDKGDDTTAVGWSGILVTLIVSIVQSAAFYLFFLYKRSQHRQTKDYSLYEPRQYVSKHCAPFSENWIQDAWNTSQDDLLDIVGLDTFMYLRFLRLGMRISAVGVLSSTLLIPLYAILGENKSEATSQFNRLTIARVESGSSQLWVTAILWCLFVSWILYELWTEWQTFYDVRLHGDADKSDIAQATRLAVRVESSEPIQSNATLAKKFKAIVPTEVRQVNVFWKVDQVEKAMEERQKAIELVEKATAFSMANPQKPRPKTRIKSTTRGLPCDRWETVDTIYHFTKVIELLNKDIDDMRQEILKERHDAGFVAMEEIAPIEWRFGPSSTGMVGFASLDAKETVMKRQYPDMELFPATDPRAALWNNMTVPLKTQKRNAKLAAVVLTIGFLFWTVPVGTVTATANLHSILKVLGLRQLFNQNSVAYGLISGLLPVVALTILMIALYSAIVAIAKRWIRFKSVPEVDAYTLRWHMLFQFANLWLILIGGSFFNQIDGMAEDPTSVVSTIATALPGASTFFVNMITVGGLGNFGLELSMFPHYGLKLLEKFLVPEAERTQRMIDAEKVPPEIEWGNAIPQHVFVFLVMIIYQPFVPLMELFAFVYFLGSYVVWRHQFLHVYCQTTEGRGVSTWQSLFGFLMACLYMSELVFIAYMEIKKAPGPAALGFGPLMGTIIFHLIIHQVFIIPSLSDFGQSEVDQRNEEIIPLIPSPIQANVYRQPCLSSTKDERQPMPYRRTPE